MRIAELYYQFELVQKFQACDNISSKVAFLTNKWQTFQTILVYLHTCIRIWVSYRIDPFYIFREQDEDHEEK